MATRPHIFQKKMSEEEQQQKVRKSGSSGTRCAVSWFLSFTSIGGLAQSRATDRPASRVAWAVVFVAGFTMTLWNFAGVMDDYHAKKVFNNIYIWNCSSATVPKNPTKFDSTT